MIFDKNTFYAKLDVLLAKGNNAYIERFLLDQVDIITDIVLVGQSCGPCGCGYGSLDGDSRLCDNGKEAKWLEERTFGIVTVLNELACFYRDSNKLKKSIETFYRLEKEILNSSITKTLDYVQVILNKADTYRIMGEYENSLVEFKSAQKILESIDSNDYYVFANIYNNKALVYQDLKDFSSAIECLEKSMLCLCKTEDKKVELATGLSNLAMSYYYIENYEGANLAIDESLEIFKEINDDSNPRYAGSLNTKAIFYYYAGDFGKVAEMFELAALKIEKIFGRNREYISACKNCSYAYEKFGNVDKAQKYMTISENTF